MYYSSPDKKLFIDQARLYMDKLFSDFKGDVILQNAIDTYYPEQGLSFFNSAKMIIIDRDPRDIYVEVINSRDLSYLGELFLTQQNVKKFVLDFKKRRIRQDEFYKNKNILIIRFESFIMDYNKTLSEIFVFSNFAADSHISPYAYFNPEISIKNIGVWKTYKYQDEIEYIYNELKDYCYEE